MALLPYHVGPHFAQGETRIGRDRLKPGYVAFSPNSKHLRDAIRELCHFALGRKDSVGIPAGIVYRIVDDVEAAAIRQSIFNLLGPSRFNEMIERFQLRLFRHTVDEEYVRHMFNRHSDRKTERLRGQVPLLLTDFEIIPDMTTPPNIVGAGINDRGRPFLQYEACIASRYMLFEEVHDGGKYLVTQTMHKKESDGG